MARVVRQESEIVEFKERWTDSALEALAAFANHKGGTVYVGIADDGRPVGWSVSDDEQQRIINQVVQTLGLRPRVRVEKLARKDVLAIQVEPTTIPTPCRGRYLTRVGTTNRDMTPDQVGRRLMEQLGESWDALSSKLNLKDLDNEAFHRFARIAQGRLPKLSPKDPPKRALENLDLLSDGFLTKGAVLLFGKRPRQACASARLQMGRFKGEVILDNRFLDGTLWEQLDAAMDALRGYLQVKQEVRSTAPTVEGLQRHDIWEYPLDALREAIINALIHRDYTVSGHIQVRVEDDSIRIWSPGDLPPGMTLAKLLQEPHGSRPRNPFLAEAFFFAGLIESWGTGIGRMRRLCREQGLPEPDFREEAGGFLVMFTKDRFSEDRLQALGLTEAQLRVARTVKEQGLTTNRAVQELLGVSRATVIRLLDDLVRKGVLVRRGKTGRATHYVLNASETPQTTHKRPTNDSNGSRRG